MPKRFTCVICHSPAPAPTGKYPCCPGCAAAIAASSDVREIITRLHERSIQVLGYSTITGKEGK